MNAATILIRCVLGVSLGASVGIALLIAGRVEQGIGIAIIGGLLGLLIAISSRMYKMSAAQTFWRGWFLALKLAALWRLPIFPGIAKLVNVEDQDIPSRHGQRGDAQLLRHRMDRGTDIGSLAALPPAIVIVTLMPRVNQDFLFLDILYKAVIVYCGVALIGATVGTAIAALTVPGVHRRNILIATPVGVVVGGGLAVVISEGMAPPIWPIYTFFGVMFGGLAMLAGMYADNVLEAEDVDADIELDDDSS